VTGRCQKNHVPPMTEWKQKRGGGERASSRVNKKKEKRTEPFHNNSPEMGEEGTVAQASAIDNEIQKGKGGKK